MIRTTGPDGAPQNSVVWIKREGDTVLFSSTDGHQKVRNLRRDPRISLSVFDLGNPSPRSRSVAQDDEIRVIIRVVPRKIVGFSA
ncbi:pyridoxamine 5'-phosphate oxidase family protein [Streptomyces sp. HUAS ZL42]|uniref:pyridoxamine 5'-phosphate oxidase family protein n=1 Tax=Streptomyces sp. HUAS ZL42 TaxID=3231715 RepID=UPI00345E3853